MPMQMVEGLEAQNHLAYLDHEHCSCVRK